MNRKSIESILQEEFFKSSLKILQKVQNIAEKSYNRLLSVNLRIFKEKSFQQSNNAKHVSSTSTLDYKSQETIGGKLPINLLPDSDSKGHRYYNNFNDSANPTFTNYYFSMPQTIPMMIMLDYKNNKTPKNYPKDSLDYQEAEICDELESKSVTATDSYTNVGYCISAPYTYDGFYISSPYTYGGYYISACTNNTIESGEIESFR